MAGEKGGLRITTCGFFQSGIGASCAWIERPDGVVYTQGWILGEDAFTAVPQKGSRGVPRPPAAFDRLPRRRSQQHARAAGRIFESTRTEASHAFSVFAFASAASGSAAADASENRKRGRGGSFLKTAPKLSEIIENGRNSSKPSKIVENN